ncbi:MAG TPA: hypothetical protein VKT31_02115, partial [Solirubrobacteraceae bacterium]|nr:hypothetical protein [Solirubrobacteraceae bacterium]
MRRALLILTVVAALLGVAQPAAARTRTRTPTISDVAVTLIPVGPKVIPAGWKVDAGQAFAIARTSPEMLRIHRSHHPLTYQVLLWPGYHYEVEFWFHKNLIAAQVVNPNGRLGPTYTGGLIIGIYARGHYGAIWDKVWVWLPLGLAFLLPLAFMRRRSWWDVADLTAVLSWGVSYFLFDHLHLDAAVWLIYPPLAYLLVRMLVRGMRPRLARGRIECRLPLAFLAVGLLALIAARIWLTLHESHVMDVGEASAVGAYRILHGQS